MNTILAQFYTFIILQSSLSPLLPLTLTPMIIFKKLHSKQGLINKYRFITIYTWKY